MWMREGNGLRGGRKKKNTGKVPQLFQGHSPEAQCQLLITNWTPTYAIGRRWNRDDAVVIVHKTPSGGRFVVTKGARSAMKSIGKSRSDLWARGWGGEHADNRLLAGKTPTFLRWWGTNAGWRFGSRQWHRDESWEYLSLGRRCMPVMKTALEEGSKISLSPPHPRQIPTSLFLPGMYYLLAAWPWAGCTIILIR